MCQVNILSSHGLSDNILPKIEFFGAKSSENFHSNIALAKDLSFVLKKDQIKMWKITF
jgi:hypothetical protein